MKSRVVSVLLLGAGLSACEQTNQSLPFSADDTKPTTKTVSPSQATTLSSAAGASVQFPTGSVSSSTTITLQPVAAPANTQLSGTAASTSFKLEPAGAQLAKPADAGLKFNAGAQAKDAWLASVVTSVGGKVRESGNTRVDVKTGLAETKISQLGTLTVVIPEPQAVVRAQRSTVRPSLASAGSPLAALGTDSLVTRCGGPGNRCAQLSVSVSPNLLDKVQEAAAIYPHFDGALRINAGRAAGKVEAATSVRVLLPSGGTAENVELHASVEPTSRSVVTEDASRITITNVRFQVSGSATSSTAVRSTSAAQRNVLINDTGASVDRIDTLVIPKGSSTGAISISRSFQIRNSAGRMEDAWVSVTLPARIHQ